jgi:hypothetical protein
VVESVYTTDLKSVGVSHVGSSPTSRTRKMQSWHIGCVPAFQAGQRSSILLLCSNYVLVVQGIEQQPSKLWVAGSNPAEDAKIFAGLTQW